jgi:hypothetical protein
MGGKEVRGIECDRARVEAIGRNLCQWAAGGRGAFGVEAALVGR